MANADLTGTQHAEMHKMWADGLPISAIAQSLSISCRDVRNWRRRSAAGLERRSPRKFGADVLDQVIVLAQAQLTGREIAERLGMTRSWVDRLISKAGLREARDYAAIQSRVMRAVWTPERCAQATRKPKPPPAPQAKLVVPQEPVMVDWSAIMIHARQCGAPIAGADPSAILSAVNAARHQAGKAPLAWSGRHQGMSR